MKITFAITEINQELLPKYAYAAVNGNLSISIDSIIVFNEPHVLLLELTFKFEEWLNSTEQDFIYDSIDHDEPIFSFVKTDYQLYNFYSAWSTQPSHRLLSLEELRAAFAAYSASLTLIIHQQYKLTLTGSFLFPNK